MQSRGQVDRKKLITGCREGVPSLFSQCVSVNRFFHMYITVLNSFHAMLFFSIQALYHTRIPPSPLRVNSRIVARGFEKGGPQERRMWVESDSYEHKNMQASTPKKRNVCGK